ncbi:hypothetical protein D9M68_781490 [compost metagenome]
MESGAVLKTHSSTVKQAYLQEMSAYRKKIALKCAQYKIDLIDADIHEGFHHVLQSYLIKRQRMN